MKKIVLLALSFLITVSLGAYDYGLLLIQELESTDARAGTPATVDRMTSYAASLVPRFSMMIDDSADLFVSARMTYDTVYKTGFTPELLRAEYTWRNEKLMISLGRMQYTAPFERVADGLFDGLKASFYYPFGTIYCGLWYTGLLYKNEANVVITDKDKSAYQEPLDYGRFYETYFASRRLVGALGWEHPSVAGVLSAKTAFIFQIDLNSTDERGGGLLNSQYFMARFGLPFRNLSFEFGGVLQIAQMDGETSAGFTWDTGISYYLPLRLPSLFSITGYFSVDNGKSMIPNLVPINSKSFGRVMEISPSGISALILDYSARISGAFSASAGAICYIQSDFANIPELNLSGKNGCEVYAHMKWAPLSDIMVNIGGGYDISSDSKWKIKLGLIMAFL
jgi:hypothetical protein